MPPIAWSAVDAPWGPVHVAASPEGLVALSHLAPPDAFVASLAHRLGDLDAAPDPRARRMLDAAIGQVEAYLAGQLRRFDLPLDLGPRPAWDRAVLAGVAEVPWGEVTSYGRLARRIGRPGAARAAGGAVGRNPVGLIIPCHRVVAGDGTIGGYGGSWWGARDALLDVKRELLRLEGIELPARRFAD